jgi:hypothetical protein
MTSTQSTTQETTSSTDSEDQHECESQTVTRLEYVPHDVAYTVNPDTGELEPTGDNELLDASWNETDHWMCPVCETFFEGQAAALNHVKDT